jgi:hypothetical protein
MEASANAMAGAEKKEDAEGQGFSGDRASRRNL